MENKNTKQESKPMFIEILRNRNSVFDNIKEGKNLNRYLLGSTLTIIFFCGIYGAIMGLFGGKNYPIIIFMDMVKVPLLFLITLYVTSPSFFVVSTLTGVNVGFRQILTLLSISYAVSATVLVSFSPVTFVYSLTTDSHTVIHLVNYTMFGIAGLCGAFYLLVGAKSVLEQKEKGTDKSNYSWLIPLIIGGIITLVVGPQLVWLMRPYFHYYDSFIYF